MTIMDIFLNNAMGHCIFSFRKNLTLAQLRLYSGETTWIILGRGCELSRKKLSKMRHAKGDHSALEFTNKLPATNEVWSV